MQGKGERGEPHRHNFEKGRGEGRGEERGEGWEERGEGRRENGKVVNREVGPVKWCKQALCYRQVERQPIQQAHQSRGIDVEKCEQFCAGTYNNNEPPPCSAVLAFFLFWFFYIIIIVIIIYLSSFLLQCWSIRVLCDELCWTKIFDDQNAGGRHSNATLKQLSWCGPYFSFSIIFHSIHSTHTHTHHHQEKEKRKKKKRKEKRSKQVTNQQSDHEEGMDAMWWEDEWRILPRAGGGGRGKGGGFLVDINNFGEVIATVGNDDSTERMDGHAVTGWR